MLQERQPLFTENCVQTNMYQRQPKRECSGEEVQQKNGVTVASSEEKRREEERREEIRRASRVTRHERSRHVTRPTGRVSKSSPAPHCCIMQVRDRTCIPGTESLRGVILKANQRPQLPSVTSYNPYILIHRGCNRNLESI